MAADTDCFILFELAAPGFPVTPLPVIYGMKPDSQKCNQIYLVKYTTQV